MIRVREKEKEIHGSVFNIDLLIKGLEEAGVPVEVDHKGEEDVVTINGKAYNLIQDFSAN
ncbi:MAG TPA: hypothetical protein EYO81_00455 [Gammaproteobacteria bacterium]|jgi:hypothetical protein|nr:hypothetical protein [Gammaproteobacteria bacterium]